MQIHKHWSQHLHHELALWWTGKESPKCFVTFINKHVKNMHRGCFCIGDLVHVFQKNDFPTSEGGIWGGRKLIMPEDAKHVTSVLIENYVRVWPVKTLGGEKFTFQKLVWLITWFPNWQRVKICFNWVAQKKKTLKSPPSFGEYLQSSPGRIQGSLNFPLRRGGIKCIQIYGNLPGVLFLIVLVHFFLLWPRCEGPYYLELVKSLPNNSTVVGVWGDILCRKNMPKMTFTNVRERIGGIIDAPTCQAPTEGSGSGEFPKEWLRAPKKEGKRLLIHQFSVFFVAVSFRVG